MKYPESIVGKNGKEYFLTQFNVTTDWHKHSFNIMAYGYPHARNIVNKMLGREHTATKGMRIERVGQIEDVKTEHQVTQPALFA